MKLYSQLVKEQPASGDAWYGLVRAELGADRFSEAYPSADEAIQKAPQTPGAETAAGLAAWRKGQLSNAEGHFRAALKLDPRYPGALMGLATDYSSLSKFRTAQELRLNAWKQSPDDPVLIEFHANSLKGAEHIAALETAIGLLDPGSDEARRLRVHIANDRALGDTKTRRLVSPYQNSSIKLIRIMSNPTKLRGMGIEVKLNGKETVKLLLDTGASELRSHRNPHSAPEWK